MNKWLDKSSLYLDIHINGDSDYSALYDKDGPLFFNAKYYSEMQKIGKKVASKYNWLHVDFDNAQPQFEIVSGERPALSFTTVFDFIFSTKSNDCQEFDDWGKVHAMTDELENAMLAWAKTLPIELDFDYGPISTYIEGYDIESLEPTDDFFQKPSINDTMRNE